MKRTDTRTIPDDPGEIRLFTVVRDEALLLPYFLQYYFERGVDRVIAVDNGSTDETPSLLLDHPRTHLFDTEQSYDAGQSGRLWLLPLLARYGTGHWCIIVDGDEVLAYPNWETLALPEVCAYLDGAGEDTLFCHFLDMYSDVPIRETRYRSGRDPLLTCPYFDAEYERVKGTFHDHPNGTTYEIDTHIGGMRRRVFGVDPYLSKVPLVRYDPSMLISRGWHGALGVRFSELQGVVFHFKYFHDFPERVAREARRPERINVVGEYRGYVEAIRREPDLCLHYDGSERFRDSDQLVRLGIMKTTPEFDRLANRTA